MGIQNINNTSTEYKHINQLDYLTCIEYTNLHTAEYSIFSSAYETLTKIKLLVAHETTLNKKLKELKSYSGNKAELY